MDAFPNSLEDAGIQTQSLNLVLASGDAFTGPVQLSVDCCRERYFNGTETLPTQREVPDAATTIAGANGFNFDNGMAPLVADSDTTIPVDLTTKAPETAFGEFTATFNSNLYGVFHNLPMPKAEIHFVRLPPTTDEPLTRCVPWNGPPGTPAPWGGASATPPEVFQMAPYVDTMVGLRGTPMSVVIFFSDPWHKLFPHDSILQWQLEDEANVPMDQSDIVLNNGDTTSAQIVWWNSSTCNGGLLSAIPGQMTDPSRIYKNQQNAPPPYGATTTLFFRRQFGGYWYDVGIFTETAFWSFARGKK